MTTWLNKNVSYSYTWQIRPGSIPRGYKEHICLRIITYQKMGGGSKQNDEGFVWSCYIGGWRAAKIMMKASCGLVILEGGGQQRE